MKTIVIILALLIVFACIVGKSMRRIKRPVPDEDPINDEIPWGDVRP